MIVLDIFVWWYGVAWMNELKKIQSRTVAILESFSVGLLARTLFAPFRQIDAGSVRGSLETRFRAWSDRTFSRVMGFFVRSLMIVTGCLLAIVVALGSVLYALLWLLIPFLPLVGLVFVFFGWTPK